ncbi:DNA ligase-like protein isoform X2 [Wolffia australiana]
MAASAISVRGSGVCMMNTGWRDEQHPHFIHFISSFLSENSYRLNFLPIAPDFIFNNGGLSVAFIFVTCWDTDNVATVFSRVRKLKRQFGHFYVVVVVPTREQNDSFYRSYFKYGVELGCPTFVTVRDPEMGFEKILKIAHAHGVCKREDVTNKLNIERRRQVQGIDMFLRVITSIPGIDGHDANALLQTVGSIESIAKASKAFLLENTDLSTDKADRIVRFFRDAQFYMSPKLN